MATLAVQELLRDSAIEELTLSNAAASDTWPNTGEESLLFLSDNAAALTATIAGGGSGIQAVGDATLQTRATAQLTMGNAQPSLGMSGKLDVGKFGTAPVFTPSSTTSLKLAVVKVF